MRRLLGGTSQEIANSLATLYDSERWWRDKQPFLKERGYMLRPRFRPGWIPSWVADPFADPILAEDSARLPVGVRAYLCRFEGSRNISGDSDKSTPHASQTASKCISS